MEVLVEIGRKNENPLFPPSFTEVDSRSTEEIKEDIKLAKELGAKVLGFTGGEPTIRKDIFELVSYAKSLEIPVIRIQSNGIKFEDMEFAISLSKFVDSFRIFLFGREEIHDYLVQVKGAYKQVVKGIENLKKLGKTVEIDTVLTKENYKEIAWILRFCKKNEIDTARFFFLSPYGSMSSVYEKFVYDIYETFKSLRKFLDYSNVIKLNILLIEFLPCVVIGYKKFLDSSFLSTVYINSGNVKSFSEILFLGRKKIKSCQKCLEKNCPGFWTRYLKKFNPEEKELEILTDNEKCMIVILLHENNITTKRILELKGEKGIRDFCVSCSGEDDVSSTGRRLIEKGVVKRVWAENGYVWSLNAEHPMVKKVKEWIGMK